MIPGEGPGLELTVADHPDRLPADAQALFAAPGQACGFYDTADWYRLVVACAMPPGSTAIFALARLAGAPAAVFPLQRLADGTLQSLTTPYTCLYRPLAAALPAAGLQRIGEALARHLHPGLLRLDALDPAWPGFAPLRAGLRRAGLAAQDFDHFGNWHEPVAGQDWAGYLASRDGRLRETIRRRTARLAREPAIGFELLRTAAEIGPGIAAFETVYASSWKDPEPHPHFNAGLIRMAAAQGTLRLGILRHGDHPIAVQLWISAGGRASVLKLAHDEAHRALSPGTVLTARMIHRLLDEEHVDELDFGRGDDPYKRGWAARRRQRTGLVLADPRSPAGLAAILRHLAGRLRRRIRPATPRPPH